jgi:hypothetical protein
VNLFKRLLGSRQPPKPRIRVCIECGMPIAEHKEWCTILLYQKEREAKAAGAVPLDSRSTGLDAVTD